MYSSCDAGTLTKLKRVVHGWNTQLNLTFSNFFSSFSLILFHFLSFSVMFFFFLSFSFIFFHFLSFSFIFLHFLSFSFIFFHFLSFSFIFLHFLSFSFIFFHFPSFSFMFFHFLSFSYIFLHFLSFSFMFFHFLSLSFIVFHCLSFSFIFVSPTIMQIMGPLPKFTLHDNTKRSTHRRTLSVQMRLRSRCDLRTLLHHIDEVTRNVLVVVLCHEDFASFIVYEAINVQHCHVQLRKCDSITCSC